MMRRAHRASPPELSTPDLLLRIRWARAKKAACPVEAAAWRLLDAEEVALLAELRERFGVENLTPPTLEWLIGGGPSLRRPTLASVG